MQLSLRLSKRLLKVELYVYISDTVFTEAPLILLYFIAQVTVQYSNVYCTLLHKSRCNIPMFTVFLMCCYFLFPSAFEVRVSIAISIWLSSKCHRQKSTYVPSCCNIDINSRLSKKIIMRHSCVIIELLQR